jgi:hypothetical protein
MSLLRLLTTSKSLVDLRDAENPYRLSSQRLLPHFGPTRNPFTSRPKMDLTPTEARSPQVPGGTSPFVAKTGSLAPRREPAAVPQKRAEHRAVSAKFDARILALALWRKLAGLLRWWMVKLGGLFARSDRKPAKSAIPRFPKPAVQGELSLERIKVMRNDLSDADLELVPARMPAAPATSAPNLPAVEKAEVTRSVWGRVTTRFMGAGKA